MFWFLLTFTLLPCALIVLFLWYRGRTIQDLVRNPPKEVDLPEVVAVLGYLHHELIKHRLPLVRTVADRELEDVQLADVDLLKQVLTGKAERPTVVDELEGYLSGLRRAAGSVRLNFWRDPLVRKTRSACRMIQGVADGLGGRVTLTPREHAKLRQADQILDEWFRPRLQALRNSVLNLELEESLFQEPVDLVRQELGLSHIQVELPTLKASEPILVRMLRDDFDLALRNLVRNALKVVSNDDGGRVAIDVETRLELTGEESVLIRIHDTNPTLLTRDMLYGGQIGRGLNLVTTTLRRYGGSLGCSKSRREGFEKYLEVRLFRELSEQEHAGLLDERDWSDKMVPTSVVGGLALSTAASLLFWSGFIPDPMQSVVEGLFPDPDAARIAREERERREELENVSTARIEANASFNRALSGAISLAQSQFNKGKRPIRIPNPSALKVDRERCESRTYQGDNEPVLELECHLVDKRKILWSPYVMLDVTRLKGVARGGSLIDLSRLTLKTQEFIQVDPNTRNLAGKNQRCLTVTALAPNSKLPPKVRKVLQRDGQRGNPKNSRLLVDYSRCLEEARYPIEAKLSLARPEGDLGIGLTENEKKPLKIDLKVQFRRFDDARKSYARMMNQGGMVLSVEKRRSLVQKIARYVAALLLQERASGSLRTGDQYDLSQAVYYGWIRPAFDTLLEARAEFEKRPGKNRVTDLFCSRIDDIDQGIGYMQDLDAREVRTDKQRSKYLRAHALLWQNDDLDKSFQAFRNYLNHDTSSELALGAHFFLSLISTLGAPPEVNQKGVSGAIIPGTDVSPEASNSLERAVASLRKIREGSGKKIRLIGAREIFKEDRDEAIPVDDILCAFYTEKRPWAKAMNVSDLKYLFKHCPNFIAPRAPSLLSSGGTSGTTPEATDPEQTKDPESNTSGGQTTDSVPSESDPEVGELGPLSVEAAQYIGDWTRTFAGAEPRCGK